MNQILIPQQSGYVPADRLVARRGRLRTALPMVAAVAAVTALAGVALGTVALLRPAKPVAARARAVARFLDVRPGSLRFGDWATVETPYGARVQSTVAGLGIVQVNAATGEVDEVIVEGELAGTGGPVTSAARAVEAARAYAEPRFAGFSALTLRGAQYLDHDAWREYRVSWQLRSGPAWTPTEVAVGVNAETGRIAYYWSSRVALGDVPAARVTARAAVAEAIKASGLGAHARVGTPELRADLIDGVQRLVWVVPLDPPAGKGVRMSNHVVVHVDALTGVGSIYARG